MKAKRRPWIVSAVLILISLLASGQSVPQLINYQGRLANASGQPITGTVNLTFTFYSAATAGAVYLAVLQSNVQVTNGVYNLLIGSGTITHGDESSLAAVFQKHDEVWMGIKVNGDAEMTPRAQITSVPYALRAQFAQTVQSVDASAIYAALGADPDHDHDGHRNFQVGGDDCNDNDPNNWASCSTCADNDLDGWFGGCDAYITLPGPDCDDSNPAVYPGAPEICDQVDNQCPGDLGYGQTDEGCPSPGSWKKLITDVRITSTATACLHPSLVYTGSQYGVAWQDNRDGKYEVYFARISADGVKQGADVRITSSTISPYYPSLVWTGTEFGVAWEGATTSPQIYFARISASGTKVGGDVQVSATTGYVGYPSLAWASSQYGVAWPDDRGWNSYQEFVYFARLSASGVKQGVDTRINTFSSSNLRIVGAGSQFGIIYYESNVESWFSRISSAGVKQGSDVGFNGLSYGITWSGSEFGVTSVASEHCMLSRISSDGVNLGEVQATDSFPNSFVKGPSLAWSSAGYGIAWEDNRDRNWEIFFSRISAGLVKQGNDIRITNNPEESHETSLAGAGLQYGVAWVDYRDGNSEIYFTTIGFSP